jgi:hypothetical protein
MTSGWADLRCEAVAVVDEHFPRRLRVRLVDAAGRSWFFVDKEPVFSASDRAIREPDLPAPVVIRCEVLGASGAGLVTVSTARPDGVEAEDGTTTFDVRADSFARWPGSTPP